MIKIKRIYDPPSSSDGRRVLVDRLWPRGIKKEEAEIDEWLKDIAPSNVLRKWFAHDPAKWPAFKVKYGRELKDKKELLGLLREKTRKGRVTLLFSAKDPEHNNAVVLKKMIERADNDEL